MVAERGVISYPIPIYQNVPIEPQFYQPRNYVIAAITLGQTTLVTTSVNHDYVIGQEVRLLIPPSFGCIQLNGQIGVVLSIPSSTQIVLNIYSLGGNAFIASPSTVQSAQTVPVGDYNSGQINPSGRINNLTYIPGSFINISPL